MNLPVINPFQSPYEVWITREPTIAEHLEYHRHSGKLCMPKIKVELHYKILNAKDAANHICDVGSDRGLSSFIEDQLENSSDFKVWQQSMPSETPKALEDYQRKMSTCNMTDVHNAIGDLGLTLTEGQYLFHGGHWNFGNEFTTNRPLSTTFCPEVAYMETFHRSKNYDAGQIDIWVLKVTNPRTNIFVYKHEGTLMGHEKEVVFNAGANLKLISSTKIGEREVLKCLPGSLREVYKTIPMNVLEIEIS